jgi:hypothetical protein
LYSNRSVLIGLLACLLSSFTSTGNTSASNLPASQAHLFMAGSGVMSMAGAHSSQTGLRVPHSIGKLPKVVEVEAWQRRIDRFCHQCLGHQNNR